MSSAEEKPAEKGWRQEDEMIQRGVKEPNNAGIATFVGLRALDPFLQYAILGRGLGSSLIHRLGGTTLPQGPALITNTPIDGLLGLSPYRSILLGLSVTSMLKQNIHVLSIMQERVEPDAAVKIGLFNAITNSINSLLFVTAQTSASVNGEHFPQTPLLVGVTLFAAGIGIEFGSEIQRHFFKKDPANKGKVYEGGLFGLSRHINYFGYTLWRTGYAVASGGWIFGAVVGAALTFAFSGQIVILQKYLEDKYGENYEHYKKAVPYKFVPFVW